MSNYKITPDAGANFHEVAAEAKRAAYMHPVVEFEFNGIKCLVNGYTNLQYLFRDYRNAFTMQWETVGPDCVENYDDETAAELKSREDIIRKRQEEAVAAQEAKYKLERDAVELVIKDTHLEVIPEKQEDYDKFVANNSNDDYSRCVVDYADFWGRLMQLQLAEGKTVADVADETQSKLSFFGITGFMYGCAVQTLSYFWPHGEELRVWHNKQYGHEGEGIVNPAVMTIGG